MWLKGILFSWEISGFFYLKDLVDKFDSLYGLIDSYFWIDLEEDILLLFIDSDVISL